MSVDISLHINVFVCWHSETGSLFQRWGDASRNVIFNELAGGRARVTTEEVPSTASRLERDKVMQLGGLSGCENLVCKRQ